MRLFGAATRRRLQEALVEARKSADVLFSDVLERNALIRQNGIALDRACRTIIRLIDERNAVVELAEYFQGEMESADEALLEVLVREATLVEVVQDYLSISVKQKGHAERRKRLVEAVEVVFADGDNVEGIAGEIASEDTPED